MDLSFGKARAHLAGARRAVQQAVGSVTAQGCVRQAVVRAGVAAAPSMSATMGAAVTGLCTATYMAGEYVGRQVYEHTNMEQASERVGKEAYRRFPHLFK